MLLFGGFELLIVGFLLGLASDSGSLAQIFVGAFVYSVILVLFANLGLSPKMKSIIDRNKNSGQSSAVSNIRPIVQAFIFVFIIAIITSYGKTFML